MKMDVNIKTAMRPSAEVNGKIHDQAASALTEVTALIANYAIRNSPYLYGHNRKSIFYDVDAIALSAQIYSTSGYGGYLETGTKNIDGTVKMAPRPYMKPGLDLHFGKFPMILRGKLAAL